MANLLNKYDIKILWIFIVLDLPFAGIFIYLILGINRIKTTGAKIDKASKNMHKAKLGMEGAFLMNLSGVMKFNFKPSEPGYMTMLDKLLPLTFPTLGNNVSLLEERNQCISKNA